MSNPNHFREPNPRPTGDFRWLFGFIATLWLLIVVGDLWMGKVSGRHGVIAWRSHSPGTYWVFTAFDMFLFLDFVYYMIKAGPPKKAANSDFISIDGTPPINSTETESLLFHPEPPLPEFVRVPLIIIGTFAVGFALIFGIAELGLKSDGFQARTVPLLLTLGTGAFVFYLVRSFLRGRMNMRGTVYTRADQPIQFWLVSAFAILSMGSVFVWALYESIVGLP